MRRPNQLPIQYQKDLEQSISDLDARLAMQGVSFSRPTLAMMVLLKQLQDQNEAMQKLLDERNET